MRKTPRARLLAYGVAVLATAASLLLRLLVVPEVANERALYISFVPAVMIAAYLGGLRPGLLATLLSLGALGYFFIGPRYSLWAQTGVDDWIGLTFFALVGTVISGLSELLHRSRRRIAADERRYAVTLSSIGDAVIATDKKARVAYLNPVAEALTGWPQEDAIGRPLAEVFHIINEQTRQPVEDPAAKVLRLGAVVGLANHTALLARDGREIPIDDCGAPIIDDRGGVRGVVLVFRDVTQRRGADEAEVLRRANARLELAVRGSNLAIWEVDMPDGRVENGRVTLVNAWESLGCDPAEAPTDFAGVFALAVHPEDRARVGRAIQACLDGESREFDAEYRITHNDGSEHWHLTRGTVLRDPTGRPIRFIGSRVDITDLKRAEEALRTSEQRFRTFVDHATDAFFLFDDGYVILDVNRQACESLGYTRDELLGMTSTVFDTDATPAHREAMRRKLDEGRLLAFESRHRRKDGTVFPVEVRGQSFWEGGRRFVVALARDITERKCAEESLRESEHRWRSLTEALPQLVWTTAPDGSSDYFSTQWTQHTGIPESELLGWRWLEALHPDDQERTRQAWTAAVQGPCVYDVEYRIRRFDGEYRWFKTRGVPIRDGEGNIFKWFGTCTDITTAKQLEEDLRQVNARLDLAVRGSNIAVWEFDMPDGVPENAHVYGVNIWEQLGYDRAEAPATFADWIAVVHPDDHERMRRTVRASLSGETSEYEVEYRVRHRDGAYRWVLSRGVSTRDVTGKPILATGIRIDITDRKRAEDQLRQLKEAAEAANRAKDEFLANVSHEIRTPMNAILGMTELALDTPLTDDQRKCLRTVKSAADNLLGIINDLLDFSKIEAGKMELDPADFSLRAAVGDTLRALAVRAHKKGLELLCHVRPDAPDALVGDAGRLRQVLLNLVGNAIKFTDAGEVVVRVRPEMEPIGPIDPMGPISDLPEALLHFEVRDTGIGIPPDKQATIFRAFEQEDTSTTRKYGGTGLGLTIAARLAALMGGRLAVDSAPGRGSTFVFTARFGLQPRPAEPNAAPPPILLRNLPVLIVDDNATNRHILEQWLHDWQIEAKAVGDAAAAMDALWHRAANGRPYALVLLDARMPDRDGLTVAAMIRERTELSATRLVLLTSGDRPGDPARFRELRIDAHLLKPVQQEELLETIYRVMSRPAGNGSTKVRPAPAQEPPATPVLVAPPLHVLVAEDNEFSARLMDQLLSRRGHRVRLANNGREALALAEEGAFDLLLLDIHMPELDGFGIIKAIRERERAAGGHLPVIALTARSRKEDRERCLAAGMDDFLTKPVSTAALFAAIERLASAPGVSRPSQADARQHRSLLDPVAVLTACGDDAEGLRKMCQDFQTYAPARLAEVGEALRNQDAPRLSRAAHKFCALLFAFSTVAGDVASDLEDRATQGQLGEVQPLVEQLETMTKELMRLAGALSLEALRRQAEASAERRPAGRPVRRQGGDS